MPKLKVGISSCLLGQSVRYDGGHCHSNICSDTLQTHFQYIPFCPEVSAGFGTPRAPMNLVINRSTPQLQYAENIEGYPGKAGVDLSGKLVEGFLKNLDQAGELDGYITKSRSPSCGFGSTPIYQRDSDIRENNVNGLFISALKKKYPLLPIVEEVDLENEINYRSFLEDVYAYHGTRPK